MTTSASISSPVDVITPVALLFLTLILVAIPIIFQQELRRGLERLGETKVFTPKFLHQRNSSNSPEHNNAKNLIIQQGQQ